MANSNQSETESKPLQPPNKTSFVSGLPERYLIQDIGSEKVLTCLEAPNLQVRIKAGMSVSASTARKSPPGTIYLDGVAQGEPFLDHEKQVYNLDHHEGCIRAFTLATCEQALIMNLKGLELREREWKIYANEPDLDTLLAIWILFNHLRLNLKEPIHRRVLFALVRLEGVIDSLGLELKEFSGLPAELLQRIMRIIDYLRSEEIRLKKEGAWAGTDYLQYAVDVLHKIDNILYRSSDFVDFKGVAELARVELTNNRIAAVVDSDLGIYELEPHLNKLYGNRLGWVILRKGPNMYTLRQMDLFMPVTLEDVYERLNFEDPAVKCRTRNNKWGGSGDIGGSPRETGTRLSPQEIALACRDAVRKRSGLRQAKRLIESAALAAAVIIAAQLIQRYWRPSDWLGSGTLTQWLDYPRLGFYLVCLTLTAFAMVLYALRRPWQYGLILPTGRDWWILLPACLAFGLAGGVILPAQANLAANPLIYFITVFFLSPVAMELLFRGLIHGMLAQGASVQSCDSRWFLSWPNLVAAFLYSGLVVFNTFDLSQGLQVLAIDWPLIRSLLSALAFGLAAGFARERSQSILPACLFHAAAVAGPYFLVSVLR
jgi:membrane protease YdiL (CAAX protease family)